jgi:acyl-CoA thioesterase-1
MCGCTHEHSCIWRQSRCGATPGHDFPTLLSAQLGVTVTNLGHSGDTTADALARIDQGLQAKPDVVILLLGGNDVLQRVPQTTTQQNLGTIIDTFQKADTKVVLVGVMGGFPSDPYASMYRDLAKTYKVPLVPNILSGLFGNQSLMRDEVHPNDAGYAKVAAKIAPAVEAACAAK